MTETARIARALGKAGRSHMARAIMHSFAEDMAWNLGMSQDEVITFVALVMGAYDEA